jgi:DNA-binding CsgD family transcriptional regulator
MCKKLFLIITKLTIILFIFSNCSVEHNNLQRRNFELLQNSLKRKFTPKDLIRIGKRELKQYTKTNEIVHLLNHKYVNFYLNEIKMDNGTLNERLHKLYDIALLSENVYPEMQANVLYELGNIVQYSNYSIAIKYWNKAIKTCSKIKYKEPIAYIYRAKGEKNYFEKRYHLALNYFKIAHKYYTKNDFLYKASMLNNIALSYIKLNKLEYAKKYYILSKKEINKVINPTKYEEFFTLIIDCTESEILINQGEFNESALNLEKILDFLEKNIQKGDFIDNYLRRSNQLIEIYYRTNNLTKIHRILKNLNKIEINFNKEKDIVYKINLLLIDTYKLLNDNENLIQVLLKHKIISHEFKEVELSYQQKSSKSVLNNISKIEARKNELELEKKQSEARFNQFILFFVLLVTVLILIILINRYKFHRELLQKNHEIVIFEKQQLEQENKLKEERLSKLNLNINLKNESERIFLEKIKEIRRSNKDKNTENVLKDVQFKLKNLLEIDTKNSDIAVKSDESKRLFFENLLAKHPNLSTRELELCSHIQLGLTSKEIATIEDVVSGTIRVYKTKLKAKLGIPREETIEEYLKELMG